MGEWLAATIRRLLEEKYGGNVPGVRRISADIKAVCDGQTISHGHIHNILSGEADNLTDRTRALLAKFFGKPLTAFHPPRDEDENENETVQALAARFATLDARQVAAIKQAIEIVTRDK
ncbi:hypothetical protein ACIA8G_21325 [Lentzea sp. NPDC051213]|uniref:hypothetical protein n=1 Tax=Lentzea sp. NPDC051213 TaxID=3364126 RepID=UPI00378B7BAB